MLSFSSISNESGKSSIEALNYCKIILKSFKKSKIRKHIRVRFTYICFNGRVFRQKEGYLGSNISGILDILFMERLETFALSSHLYVDDIYLQTTGEEMADHSTIQWTIRNEIEKPEITPSGLSLSLLDSNVTISKDGKSSFEFYKKIAKKPPPLPMPEKSKINFKWAQTYRRLIYALPKRQPQNIKTCLTTSSV